MSNGSQPPACPTCGRSPRYGFWDWMRDHFTEKALLALVTAASIGFGSCNVLLNQRTKEEVKEVKIQAAAATEEAKDAAEKASKTGIRVKSIESAVNDLWLEGADPKDKK